MSSPLWGQPEDRNVATFDDSPEATIAFIVDTPEPFMYEGLIWRGFDVIQSDHESLAKFARSGYAHGAVSGNFAVVAAGRAVTESLIERRGGGSFAFYGAHFTAAWRTDLVVTVEGLVEGAIVFSTELLVAPTGPVGLEGAWQIDQLKVRAAGGSDSDACPPMDCYPGPEVIVDDVVFSLTATEENPEMILTTVIPPEVPEPSVDEAEAPTPVTAAPPEEKMPPQVTNEPVTIAETAPRRPAGACGEAPYFGVQVGAFASEPNAQRFRGALSQTYAVVQIFRRTHDRGVLNHLVVGCTTDRSEAVTLFGTLLAEGTKGFVVRVSADVFGAPL